MATTQLIPNNYRLKNAIAFVNSFSTSTSAKSATFTGTLTNGNSWIQSISSNTGIAAGQLVTSSVSGIPAQTVVASVNATTVVMSQAFTGTTTTGASVNTYQTTTSGYYMFAGQSGSWPGGVVPQNYDTDSQVQFNTYNNMIFGKHIYPSDVSLMVPAYLWTSGAVYAQYDDADIELNTKQFFVYVYQSNTYYVFKCLFNNNGAASISPPTFADTGAGDTFYQTSDGYQWKYMYQIPSATFNKFSTSLYMPVIVDANVTANAVQGAIDVIIPVDSSGNFTPVSGSGYNNYFSGKFYSGSVSNGAQPLATLANTASSNNNFYNGCILSITNGTGVGQYKRIVEHYSNSIGTYAILDSAFTTLPDNTSAYQINPAVNILNSSDATVSVVAQALVNSAASNGVYQVQVLNRGSGVYNASAFVYADASVGVSNTAGVRVINPPEGGHGANVAAELYSSYVGISVTFANTESNTIPTYNDYQTIGILQNPQFANVVFTTTGQSGNFLVGETIVQTTTNATAVVAVNGVGSLQLANVSGFFTLTTNVTYGTIVGTSSNANAQITAVLNNGQSKFFETFVQLYSYNGSYTGATSFVANETVYQGINNTTPSATSFGTIIQSLATSNAVFHSNNSTGTTVYLTNKLGPIYPSGTSGFPLTGVTSSATFNINTVIEPDLVPESGDVIYIENFNAVSRSNTQSETIQLILEY